jgi:hypothetical protein
MIPIALLRRIDRWLRDHEPVFCALCLRVLFRKHALYQQTTLGRVVPLCKRCHTELFHPYSGE